LSKILIWKNRMNNRYLIILLALSLLTPACVPGATAQPTAAEPTAVTAANQPTPGNSIPVVVISSPATNTTFELGQTIEVSSGSIDTRGISRIELLVDGQPVRSNTFTPRPNTEFALKQRWTPDEAGKYTLQVRAYNPANTAGLSQQVLVQVLGPSPTPAPILPTSTPTPVSDTIVTPTPPPVPATPTATTTSAPPAGTPTPDYAYLVVSVTPGLNVRSGPSTRYSIIGRLNPGDQARIVGQSNIGAGLWWQIGYPTVLGETGWVSGSADYSRTYNTAGVPLAAPPPTPALPTPTFTPTPIPVAQQPNIDFAVDRTRINVGECVNFFWNVDNVKEVYFQGQGVPGNNQLRIECPSRTTYYELRVLRDDGNIETQTIKIDVEGEAYQTLEMDLGQKVDFDRDGRVTDDDDGNNDFEWLKVGDERRFRKWDDDDDLELAPVGPETLDIIRREDCEWAVRNIEVSEYIKPFAGLSACFRTDRGTLGKLRFDDADDEADIQWSLWK